jgi:transcriptional regulator with XRE-family HTH domain
LTVEGSKCPQWNSNPCIETGLLNKLSVTQLAELSKLSKAYISQVKNRERPPSEKLIQALRQSGNNGNRNNGYEANKAIGLFLKSRRDGISPNSISFYRSYLSKSILILGLSPKPVQLNKYLNSLSCSVVGRHAYYRAVSVFYN